MSYTSCPFCNAVVLDRETSCFSCGAAISQSETKTFALRIGIVVNNNPIDDMVAILHKRATHYKKNNLMGCAISCLFKAAELMKTTKTEFSNDSWVKLPMYLQKAGRFNEALDEFNSLISYFKKLRRPDMKPKSEVRDEWFMHSNLYSVYKSMALACKRNKNKAIETVCIDKMNHHESERDRCRILLDKENEERSARHKERRDALLKRHQVIDE